MPIPIRMVSDSSQLTDAGSFASDGEEELLGAIDVSGRRGRDGVDGQCYLTPPAGSGTHGRRGGNAGAAQRGEDAGQVRLRLGYGANGLRRDVMTLQGDVAAREQYTSPYAAQVPIGEDGYYFIDGVGGRGGNGGRGGDGQPGSVGYAGRDATRFSSGSNGGPGGDGGDAGDPSDGAPGGRGAEVVLSVDHREQGLLMLLKGNLIGGDIGFAGEPGRGGSGGRGGRGGSSYHWTETESYTDSQGNRRTRTIMRSNPGGFNGPDGRNGSASRYRAADGVAGDAGRLRIVVVDDRGNQQTFDSPFDLELVSFDVTSEYDVLEPDSLISIDNVVVRNCGGMPLPDNYVIRVYIEVDRWLLYDEVDLVMQEALAPGETFTFSHAGLRARLGDYVVEEPRNQAFHLRHPVNPLASMESGISRPFRNFENEDEILVRFPIELTPITCLQSLAPGESTRVIWAVKNIGQETFDQKYLYRAVRSSLRFLGGDLDSKHVVFFDTGNQPYDLIANAFTKPIGELRPGDAQLIETRIGIRDTPEVIPYQGFTIGVDLDLQRPRSSEQSASYRCVDYRKSLIRVSERYLRQAESRFLLIANQKTTVNEIQRWTQLADYFGSSLDVWDVSYYGFLDLVRNVDNDQSLLAQWRGMTIIIPNNYYQTPDGKTVAFEQLAKSQLLRAAADYDINFYVVGDSRTGGEAMLANSLIPIDSGDSPSRLETQTDFLREVKRWNKFVAKSQEVVGGATGDARDFADISLGAVHEFDIDKRTLLFQPSAEWLARHADRLSQRLQSEDPLHRWIIVHRYDPEDTDTSWGFFRKRNVGKLEVRRTLDSTKGSVVLYEVDGIDAIDQGFINSKANKHGIFLALKFEEKVDRFIRLVSERAFPRFSEDYIDRPLTDDEMREIGTELVDSILTDIFNEQTVAREAKTWGRGCIRELTPKLNYLAERALNYGVTESQMKENEVGLSLLYDLIANLRYMAEESKTVWDSAWLPTSFFKRSRAVSTYMINRSDRIVTSIFGRTPSWWDRISSSNDDYDPFGNSRKKSPAGIERQLADQEIARRESALHKENPGISRYSTAQDHPGLTYDPELLGKSVRVMSGEQYDKLVHAESVAARRRYETERAVQATRADLLVPLETAKPVRTETRTTTVPQSPS